MQIRPIHETEFEAWLQMRLQLWPFADGEDDRTEMRDYLNRSDRLVLVAEDQFQLLGFLEASIRNYAEGCRGEHVAFIEGWWVEDSVRRRGIGAQLMQAAEIWAREQGCEEIGSNTLLDNEISWKAHLALGWEEVERCIHFRKSL